MAKFKTAKRANVGYPVGTAQVGGDFNLAGDQIVAQVKVGANAANDGFIVRQKGAHKFLVSDGTNVGVCTLANTGTPANNQLSIECTKDDTSTFYASRITNKFVWDFAGNKYRVGAAADDSTTPETVAVPVG